MPFPADFAADDYCYLTTTGRRSGLPREIEIWFALENETLYLLSGGRDRSHWVRNLQTQPRVSVRIRELALAARAEVLGEGLEDARAREIVFAKYAPRYSGDLTEWQRTALPVALRVGEG